MDEWERVGRQLLYDRLKHDFPERLEEALTDVADDVQAGEELTTEHLKTLSRAFEEVHLFLETGVVPLATDDDEWAEAFHLIGPPDKYDE